MHEAEALRLLARRALAQHVLPSDAPDRLAGSPGIGLPCFLCERPIERDQLEIKVQWAWTGDKPGLTEYRLHARCFAGWEFERSSPDPIGAAELPRSPAA